MSDLFKIGIGSYQDLYLYCKQHTIHFKPYFTQETQIAWTNILVHLLTQNNMESPNKGVYRQ